MRTRSTLKRTPAYPRPDVEVGDDIYVHRQSGACCGCVVGRGKHGVTVRIDGELHRVKWDKVLGHKRRAPQRYAIVDEGEDGVLVEDARGRRRFIRIPGALREDSIIVKAQRPVLLFRKAESGGPIVNRPGLTQKKITDRIGRQQTKWVRVDKDRPMGDRRSRDEEPIGAAHGYGTHNLQAGDKVRFRAGDFEGTGTIVGKPGRDGAHVRDESGRVHQVRWTEITEHDKNGGESKPTVRQEVRGEQKPIPAERFSASEYAKQHDDPDVTPEQILAHFPPDTADKIKEVQERLASIEQTIDQHKREDSYLPERQELHRKIYEHFLSRERREAAKPPDGVQPTFTLLGGRGGSGKSWFKGKVYDPNKAIVLDADEIKAMLPEYEGWNAHQVHEESSDILEVLLSDARAYGLNVVLDATMKTAKSALNKVKAFKDAGYRIESHYMHLPRQEAAKRAVARFLGKTKRYVPVSVVLSNTDNEANFDQVRSLADKWSFYDNNVPHGHEPLKISEGGRASGESDSSGGQTLKKGMAEPIVLLWRKR